MQPIYFTVDKNLPLMIIPESDGHMDGHPVLTYSYRIFKDQSEGRHGVFIDKDKLLEVDSKNDPDYLGTITFEQPGRLFDYTADGQQELTSDEVREVIEQITHYRENPALWAL